MIDLLKKSFLIMLVFIASCSENKNKNEHLFGLWKSNIILSIEGNHKNDPDIDAFISEEFGKFYHYYDKDTSAIVYSDSIEPHSLLKKFLNNEDIVLSEYGVIDFRDYKVVEKRKGYYKIKLMKNFLEIFFPPPFLRSEYELFFSEENGCFYIDNSIYKNAPNEFFCKISG